MQLIAAVVLWELVTGDLMNKVTMYVPAPHCRIDVIKASVRQDDDGLRKFWDADREKNYVLIGQFFTEDVDIDACENAFDLSNNPSRKDERKLVQGLSESLSVGGVVKLEQRDDDSRVETKFLMCLTVGWLDL